MTRRSDWKRSVPGLIAAGSLALTLLSGITLTSCKDKFPTAVPDTVIRHDTLKPDSVIIHDTIRIHDTLYVIDSSVWVSRISGTASDLIVAQFADSLNGYIGGTNGTVVGSLDGGTNWNVLGALGTNGNGGTGIYGLSFVDPLRGWAVGDGLEIYHTSNGGHRWDSTTSPSSLFMRALCFVNANTGFIGTSDQHGGVGVDGEILTTRNGGATWSSFYVSQGGIMHISFLNPTTGFATGRLGTILYTSNAGANWNYASTDQGSAIIYDVAFTSTTTGFAAAYVDPSHGVILRTDDGGHTWNTIRSLPFGIQAIATNRNGMITACGFGGHISESSDGGTTWSESQVGTDRWLDVVYPRPGRTVLVGQYGRIATRDK